MAKAFARTSPSSGTKVLLKKAGLVPVGSLAIGDVITDANSWEYKVDVNYSGSVVASHPVNWIVVAKDHFAGGNAGEIKGGFEPHITLLADIAVAMHRHREELNPPEGGNDYNISQIPPFLNGTFKGHLSEYFQEHILETTIKIGSSRETEEDDFVDYDDMDNYIFLLSQVELGEGTSFIEGDHGTDLGYFTSNASRIMQRYDSDGNLQDELWWTRSAQDNASDTWNYRRITTAGVAGNRLARGIEGVRPCLNVSANMLVKKV